ncbi:MAG: FHA domain-containing protein [Myxococcota bacterium]|nr:FHA domain-containing protein [Myxococcota bacterium]
MSFQLTIAEGKEAGKEFVFDQGSVAIGRTSDCDVILYDPGVSRKHARIFKEGEEYFVEDLGSSNGTKVNGSVIKKQKLTDGDAISLGPVVFNFLGHVLEEAAEQAAASGVANQSTRIVAADSLKKRQRNKGVAMLPENAADEQVAGMQRASTMTMQAVKRTASNPAAIPVRRISASEVAVSKPAPKAAAQLSAAERARIKRESAGMIANFRIWWAQSSGAAHGAIYGLLGLFFCGLLATAYYFVIVGDQKNTPDRPEPMELGRAPLTDSFGLGPDVLWNRPDMKVFQFPFNAPVRAVVIVHFQSKDISQGEVVVTVNGADVGMVPPDTLNASDRSHEVIVPPTTLKKGEVNQVIFDNTKNPPGEDLWRIWNVWIETSLLPEIPPQQLLREAKISFERATKAFEAKDIGAVNRYEAWREFRNAWLMLEAHPEPKPELYLLAREKVKEAQQELDHTCSKLLLEVQMAVNHREWLTARETLNHVGAYFPNTDQPCNLRAEQLRYDNNL